jgi:hypothetical protein
VLIALCGYGYGFLLSMACSITAALLLSGAGGQRANLTGTHITTNYIKGQNEIKAPVASTIVSSRLGTFSPRSAALGLLSRRTQAGMSYGHSLVKW